MKKLLLALAAVAVARVVFAVDPVVVWDGDFGTSVKTGTDGKTYTLTLPTGAESWIQSDGSLKVGGGTKSAYVNLQDGDSYNLAQGTKLSVLMEYENATAQSVAACPIYLQADAYFGLKTKASTLEVVGDGWGTTYPTSGDTVTTMPPSGSILLVYPQGDGNLKVYSASTREGLTDASAGGAITALKYSNKRLQKIGLGGCFTDGSGQGLTNFTNLVIKRVAIYTSAITTDAAAAYIFPSEIQAINVDSGTTVSAINAQYDSTTYKAAKVTVASGVTITVDEAFSEKIKSVSSEGTITLSAASQPDASYFENVDFSGVKGGLLRSWLTPGVVGFNFRSQNGTDVSGALATADNWIHDNNSASGTSTAMFADGLSTLKWSSANTWACSGSTIISGYLDDGANGGNGATVTLSNVPYETYDVIVYCSSDSNPGKFLAKTVNGTTYTWDSTAGAVVAGSSVWGTAALSTPVYGVNALRIKNLTGPLTIYGTARNGSNRGGIAAFEIMPPETPDNIPTYTLTLNGTATTWSGGTWTLNNQTVDAPVDGYVEIVATASTTLTVDQAVSLTDLKVRGGENIVVNVAATDIGSIYAIKATVESGVFQQGSESVLGATPAIAIKDGATFDMNGLGLSSANAVTIAGAGAGSWPWALTSSGGAGGAILGGLYLTDDATIGGANELKIGQNGGGYYLYLQDHTLTKTGEGALTGTNMNTPGSGTIDVHGGAMSLNQWNNLNSGENGDTTVILREGTSLANNTDRTLPMGTLKLLGGTLSTSSQAFKVNTLLTGGGETAKFVFADGASASLTGDFTVTSALTLEGAVSFLKDETAGGDVVVDIPGTLTASGAITVGAGVTLNLRTNRPTAEIAVEEGATLSAQLNSASDIIELNVNKSPSSVVLYDHEGNELDSGDFMVEFNDGVLTMRMSSTPILYADDDTKISFDDDGAWSGKKPGNGDDAIISIRNGNTVTEIEVGESYTLGSLTVTGEGEVIFTGKGSITVDSVELMHGARLHNCSVITATAIALDSGTVLKIDSMTESAAISGAGAVETYGTVVLAHSNTMTGGITVKSGSRLSASTTGAYGEYSSGWAYSAQRQVVVEDGGTVDINNCANADSAVALTIAGKGILNEGVYSGAVVYSGESAITSGSRQISSLVLSDDAMVDIGKGWGLVHSGWNNARLGLNGHTLTVRGNEATFPVVNANNASGAATTGTLIMDGAKLELSNAASNLEGVGVVLRNGGSLDNKLSSAARIASLELDGGTIASASNPFAIATALTGSGSIGRVEMDDGAVATLSGDLTVAPTMTLSGAMTFNKAAEAEDDVLVDITGELTASGTITVGAGVTLNLRTNRPTTQLTVSDGATLAVRLQSDFDVVSLNVSSRPSLVVYDAEGEVVENPNVLYENNTLVIMSGLPTLPVAAGSRASFETDWLASIRPVDGGGAIIEIFSDSEHSGTAEIMVDGDYFLEGLTISGEGEVFFTGGGSLTVTNIYVKNGATLVHDAGSLSVDSIELDSGTVLKIDGITETAAISGAGAVETYGNVVLAHANTMTGGITVKPGSILSTTVARGYGEYSTGWAYSELRTVTVEDGGCVDINNVANKDAGVALTISGKGILNDGVYSGAVIYSGSSAIGNNSRQISSLSLAADAMVDVGAGWGLVHAGHSTAQLALAGHTLTMRGTGTVPMVNVNASESSGTLVMEGATLELDSTACNFTGVDIILNGCASVNFTASPSALGSLTVKPTIDGTTASAWNLPSSITSVVNTVNVDSTGLSAGELITLLTVPSSVTLSSDNISVVASGRYEPVISDNAVKLRIKDPTPFLHYDFNNGAAADGDAADTGAASDSGTTISAFGEASSVTLVKSRNGQAVHVHTDYTPYWGSYESDVSPFLSGEATVTGVFKLRETGVVLWGLGGAAENKAFGVVATSANSLAVVAKGSSGVETLVTVENTADLSSGWHFFAVVASADGTALYVDGLSASSDKVIPSGIGQQGQLGSFHGGAIGGKKVGDAGYLLDDWRVYDAAFTEDEVKELRRKVNPPPFRLMIR